MKYIKEFQNQQEYDKWYLDENYHAPNVVGIGEDPNDLDISMNDDNYLIVKLNITDNEETDLWKTDDIDKIDKIYLDGVEINDITTPLKASDLSNGEHILKIKPNNSTLGGHTLFGHKYITYAYIPGVINTIDQGTFYSCTNLKSISLSDNVKNIGSGAFNGCSSLNFDKFDHIEIIGNGAFNGCKINKIHLTKNIKSIGSGVFNGNPLEEIYMDTPAWDNTHNYYEFSNSALCKIEIGTHCINTETGSLYCIGINGLTLETVILPEGLINGPSFGGASITKYIKWPSTLQTPASFGGGRVPEIMDLSHTQLTTNPYLGAVSGIKTIILPQTVTTMQSCGGGCSVENINIPAGVTSLPSGCFSGCSSLKRIDIQGNLTSIGSGCFGGCSSLESINIPSSLIEYGGLSFGGCVKLGYVENGIRYIDINNLGTEVIQIEDHTLSSYIIKDSVKYMNTYTLQQNQIPNCTSITWPSGITNIPDSMLKNNTMLETFNIPEGITSIGNETFMNCTSLSEVTLPSTLNSIGENAFAGTNLGTIENGIKYFDTGSNILALSIADKTLSSYNIKNGTTRIEFAPDAWSDVNNIESITLPNTLTYVTNDSFNDICNVLTDAQMDFILGINTNAIKYIYVLLRKPKSYFENKNLTICALENGTINIERAIYSNYYVYYKKNGSTTETAIKGSISVSKNDTIEFYTNSDKKILSGMSLNFDAYICGNLNSIIGNLTNFNFRNFFKDSTSSYLNIDKLILPDISNCVVDNYSIVGPFTSLFENCVGIKSIPEDLLPFTTLKPYCYANIFKGCTGLTSIPENLLPANSIQKSSYEGMFANCTNLSDVPENLLINMKWLNTGSCQYMFYGCTSLVKAPTIPELSSSISNQCSYMFQGCTSLNYIKNLTWYNASCFNNWVNGVSPTGTFIKKSGQTWSTGTSGIPEGWIVEDYVETN